MEIFYQLLPFFLFLSIITASIYYYYSKQNYIYPIKFRFISKTSIKVIAILSILGGIWTTPAVGILIASLTAGVSFILWYLIVALCRFIAFKILLKTKQHNTTSVHKETQADTLKSTLTDEPPLNHVFDKDKEDDLVKDLLERYRLCDDSTKDADMVQPTTHAVNVSEKCSSDIPSLKYEFSDAEEELMSLLYETTAKQDLLIRPEKSETKRNPYAFRGIVLTFIIICILMGVGTALMAAEDPSNEVAEPATSYSQDYDNETVIKNFNKLATMYGYNDHQSMINDIKASGENMPDSLTDQYEFTVQLCGGSSYDGVSGMTSPYTNTTISSFEDYQSYIYTSLLEEWEEPYPENGQILSSNGRSRVSELTIVTQDSYAYYVKLVNPNNAKDVTLETFIQPGQTINIKVPEGTYEVRYAFGKNWYGTELLFGEGTTFCRADDIFLFSHTDGWTIELYTQSNGNLETEDIPADEF